MSLTSKHCFQLKYVSSDFSKDSHLVWIRREISTDQAPFISENMWVIPCQLNQRSPAQMFYFANIFFWKKHV